MTKKFRDWYLSLPFNVKAEIKQKIKEACEIKEYTFQNWLAGTSINKYERDIINQIAGKNIWDE